MLKIMARRSKLDRLLQSLLVCALLLAAAGPALANTILPTTAEVVAMSYDGIYNRLYFLDTAGNLKRLQLNPRCEATPPCTESQVVPSPFVHPAGVAVDAAAGLAYVTTTNGLNGTLWKVDLNGTASPTPVPVAPPLLGSAAIVLAPETGSAYVSESLGTLSRLDLSTGVKTQILPTLRSSVLAVNSARTFAYVGTTGPRSNGTITEVDLATGRKTRTLGSFSLSTSVTALAWADPSESALYAKVDGFSTSTILRVDLLTSQMSTVALFRDPIVNNQILSLRGFAVSPGNAFYLGSNTGSSTGIIRSPLAPLPAPNQIFLSIGNILAGNIDSDGYAKATDSPFGGTLDIFGNLTLLAQKPYFAQYYQILAQRSGGPFVPIQASWTAYKWVSSPAPAHYVPTLVAPVTVASIPGAYKLPVEYGSPTTAPYWSPTYLMMRWPTSENGQYLLQIRIFDSNGKQIPIQGLSDHITVQIDNTPPVANLKSIFVVPANGGPKKLVKPCDIVSADDPGSFQFEVEASDANSHLLSYSLRALWGRNQTATVYSESVGPTLGNHLWPSYSDVTVPATSGWAARCNCAHTFTLQVTKRTTNGYNYILSSSSAESITINNQPGSCP